jgi:glutamate synthase domain-containing protein 2/glutamate synthase domain-containing protein 1/glutamate synthase domain-containing protein 3
MQGVAGNVSPARKAGARGGLYDPRFEHDSCGVGFVVDIQGRRSNQIVRQGLEVVLNLRHRGAKGAEVNTGDGAGILIQIPHEFFSAVCGSNGLELPGPGDYGVGSVFLPRRDAETQKVQALFEDAVYRTDQTLLGWRDVPVDSSPIGTSARTAEPRIRQVFIGRNSATSPDAFERKLFLIRKRAERRVAASSIDGREDFYVASLSAKTIAYKGMLSAEQLEAYFPDLADSRLASALALVHQRFSTNTFPSWPLAQPFRYLAHNGEINTLRGNINWMRARQGLFASDLFADDIADLYPVIPEGGSDSAVIDNALEMLMLAGRSLPHAVMMLIPEAWDGHNTMSEEKKAFYEYHACLMEPWDGPASIAFTDGRVIGAVLDRNGLRPSRYYVTKEGLVVMASEVGVLDIPPEAVERKGRLEPGKMFLIDTEAGRIIDDAELKHAMATEQPYGEWLGRHMVSLHDLPEAKEVAEPDHETVLQRQQIFGYTHEDLRILMAPMAVAGQEGLGSMGNDTPLAVLSDRAPSLFGYFKQLFAQVTNPPLDAIREELVTSTVSYIGAERNLLAPEPESAEQIRILSPILDNAEFAKLLEISRPGYKVETLPMLFPAADGGDGLERSMEVLCEAASRAIDDGVNILVISDRGVSETLAPIPSLLATAGLHHHLVREGKRTRAALIVETGEAREVHHYCLLIGYGATAINPYLAFETLDDMIRGKLIDVTHQQAVNHYIKAVNKGIVKVMSKMGISTLQSYRGAQIFEAIGLNHSFVDRYFTWTASRIEGVGVEEIAEEVLRHHEGAFPSRPVREPDLEWGGQYQWRRDGEYHMYNPDSIHKLQYSTRTNDYRIFREFSESINDRSRQLCTLRGLLDLKLAEEPVPLAEVESAEEIMKRFATGAMSLGSISREAHETLAIAMNRIGGKSNTGEGGEDPVRYTPDPNGDSRNSAIKQVASGRFGVTSEYLVSARELQIKMAQGAKPGEGGQLPGHKVDSYIAGVRHSTPGVGLISPPPHHDIYSIEDLAQLIFDLKNSNPRARISVKLVSEVGVGTVAAGVAKAHSDVVLISGDSGGTGASPLTSIKHAGTPWELGLAETQQVLVANDLRSRIIVQTDGQIKTGRDVVVAALLGAEEYGIASAALIVSGCIMMRVCHLNTCPVGIATQDKRLRTKFAGKPEHVVNYFRFVAEEVRELMARLGFRRVEEMVGRMDKLNPARAIQHWKGRKLDLTPLLEMPEVPPRVERRCTREQDHGIDNVLDRKLVELAADALESAKPVEIRLPIRNSDRTTGTILGSEVTRRYGAEGLAPDTIGIHFRGSAGQSFGAFLPPGISMTLEGDANDYLAKGLCGGRIVVFPSRNSTFVPEENIIVGNVVLYGATDGELFVRGVAGERFCVRNSGAVAVVEGVGDHGCEYMTNGRVVVLGPTGRNFAAGMSGGIAYVFDADGDFAQRCNLEMVDLEHFEGPAEEKFVRYLIERHVNFTDSDYARRILDKWSGNRKRFVKVMPLDYRRVLNEQTGSSAIEMVQHG